MTSTTDELSTLFAAFNLETKAMPTPEVKISPRMRDWFSELLEEWGIEACLFPALDLFLRRHASLLIREYYAETRTTIGRLFCEVVAHMSPTAKIPHPAGRQREYTVAMKSLCTQLQPFMVDNKSKVFDKTVRRLRVTSRARSVREASPCGRDIRATR